LEHFDLSTTDDPDERDVRRRQLAKRLVFHQARTQTITEYTGLSRDRLETLRQRWGVAATERHRGPSPTSLVEFFRNSRNLQAATAAAVLFNLLGTLRKPCTHSSQGSTALERGEQLCYAYEALQACFPHVEIEFEHLLLLATGLSGGKELQLTHCTQCGAAILVDNLASPQTPGRHRCSDPRDNGIHST
jgi:hypothetical protein